MQDPERYTGRGAVAAAERRSRPWGHLRGHRGLECRHAPHSVDESKHRGHHHDSRDSMIDTTGGSLCELDRLSPCRLLFGQLLICNSGNWRAQRGIVRTTKDTCQSRKSAQQHRQFGLQRRQSPRLESGLSAAAFIQQDILPVIGIGDYDRLIQWGPQPVCPPASSMVNNPHVTWAHHPTIPIGFFHVGYYPLIPT